MLERKSTRLEDIMPLIREELHNGKSVRIYPRGTSMLPMLREGKDSVVLSKISEPLRKYDVVLYQRKNGQYVLHRLVKTRKEYVFLGDNQFEHEYGVEYGQMIARVSSFYRETKEINVNNVCYKIYCHLWYGSRAIRRLWRRGISWMSRRVFKKHAKK